MHPRRTRHLPATTLVVALLPLALSSSGCEEPQKIRRLERERDALRQQNTALRKKLEHRTAPRVQLLPTLPFPVLLTPPPECKLTPAHFTITRTRGAQALVPDAEGMFVRANGTRIPRPLGYVPISHPDMLKVYYLSPKGFNARTPEPQRIFEGAGLVVIHHRRLTSRQACLAFKPDDDAGEPPSKPQDVTINGVPFLSMVSGGGAAGHQWKDELYRTFRKGCCVELRLRYTFRGNDPTTPAGQAHARLANKIWKRLKAMTRSFRFRSEK